MPPRQDDPRLTNPVEDLLRILPSQASLAALAEAKSPASVTAWREAGYIPARRQSRILVNGRALGLPILPEHVVARPIAAANTDGPEAA